ncbi:hypothetical protein P9112_000231 [Eukaryota sp. TZLM1-RC]
MSSFLKIVSTLQCPVTLKLLLNPVSLRCGHSFSAECLKQWMKENSSCPVCRYEVDIDSSYTKVFLLEDLINTIFTPTIIDSEGLKQASLVKDYVLRLHQNVLCQTMLYNGRPVMLRSIIPLLEREERSKDLSRQVFIATALSSKVQSPYVIETLGATQEPLGTVSEYIGPSLRQLVEQGVSFDSNDIKTLLFHICLGVSAFHNQNLIHGCLTADCVYVSPDNNNTSRVAYAKIGDADFCLAIEEERLNRKVAFSPFKAPEVEQGKPTTATKSVDIFAMGSLFLILLTGSLSQLIPPFKKQALALNSVDDLTNEDYKKLIRKMLSEQPQQRPSCDDILEEMEHMFRCSCSDYSINQAEFEELSTIEAALAEKDKLIQEQQDVNQKLLNQHTIEVLSFQESDRQLRSKHSELMEKIEHHEALLHQNTLLLREANNTLRATEAKLDENERQYGILTDGYSTLQKSLESKQLEVFDKIATIKMLKETIQEQIVTIKHLEEQFSQSSEEIRNLQLFSNQLEAENDELLSRVEEYQAMYQHKCQEMVFHNKQLSRRVFDLLVRISPEFNDLMPVIPEDEPVTLPVEGSQHLTQPIGISSPPTEKGDLYRSKCPFCNRHFVPDRIAKHMRVCVHKKHI